MAEKSLYNPFHYRCGKTVGLKEHWAELQQHASEEEQRAFVSAVIKGKPGVMPSEALEIKKRIIKRRTTATKGSWVTFKYAADRDGEDLVKEMILNKTIDTRFNPT